MNAQQSSRFRQDLLIEEGPNDADGRVRYVIRDPHSEGVYELGEEELYLCQLTDGQRSNDEICREFKERFDIDLDEADLPAFYQQMEAYGLFEKPSDEESEDDELSLIGVGDSEEAVEMARGKNAPSEEGEPIQRNQPYRWAFFNPDHLFVALGNFLRPARYLLWLLIPGLPAAFLSLFNHQPEYLLTMNRIGQMEGTGMLSMLFKMLVGLFVTNLLSKIAQGVVCAHYGGAVGQFGFRLAYGVIPRFYINKRYIWDLPRRERLWTFAASLLTKLALFSLGTLLWLANIKTGNQLAEAALFIGHIGLAAFLFTANPLWRADGYNWLITYLEMPKLQERALQVLKMVFSGRALPEALSEREKYGLLAYGLGTLVFLTAVVLTVLSFLAVFLEERFQGTGMVLFLIVLGLFTHWSLRYLGPKVRGSAVKGGASVRQGYEAPPKQSVSAFEGTRISRKSKKSEAGYGWMLVLLIIGGVAMLPYPYEVSGVVTLYPSQRTEVRAKSSGQLVRVLAEEGQWVEGKQLLAELEDWQQSHAIKITQTEIEKTLSEVRLLLEGAKPEAIATAEEQLEMARIKAKHSTRQLELVRPGFKSGSVSELEYETALANADVDIAAVGVAEANLALAKSGGVEAEIEIKRAEIRQLEEQLRYQRDELSRTRISAPQAGKVVGERLQQLVGSYFREGDLFAELQQDAIMIAEVQVPESDISEVEVGAEVEVKVWAHATTSYKGRVTAIAPTVVEVPENPFVKVVRVTAELDNAGGSLKSQMTGYAKISGGTKSVGESFTRMLLRFFTIEMWSWVP